MKLLRFILNRKILVGLIAVLVVMVGGYAVLKLDKELFPPMDLGGAYTEINAGDMSAIEVERSITSPLERTLLGMDGIESVSSTSTIGRSSFSMTFEEGTGDDFFEKVDAAINSATAEMPEVIDVESGEIGTNQAYEFFMDVSGGSMEEMTDFAKDVLQPRLEELPEVRDVSLAGTQENEVSIKLDRDKLAESGLDINQVVGAIQEANSESTLGQLTGEDSSPTLRWNSKLESVEEVKNIEIPTAEGLLTLEDFSSVTLDSVESSSFVWKNGTKDFIFVQVGRMADVTQLEMAAAIRSEIEKIRNEGLVDGFKLTEMVAQADYVQDSIDGVTGNILIGAAIAIAILLLFLRSVRATIIIGVSIPTSVLLTFAAMWLFDYSFNILTLIGLGLGIGMMVDSSIVILESIYRKKEQGHANLEAVLTGTQEVATAVFASMLTTIVVFLPIGMVGGELGQFMIILSFVVTFTLISSVVVSFTLIPSLAEKFLTLRKQKKRDKEGPITKLYTPVVSWIVKKKRYSLAVIAIFFAMFAGSLFLVTKIPMTIMPDVFNRYSELMVDVETGVSPEEKEVVEKINTTLLSIKDVETNYVMDNGSMFYTIINMNKEEEITREQKDINEEIMSSLRALEDDTPLLNVQSAMSGGGGYPIQVNIKGEDFQELETLANGFKKDLGKIEGIVGVTSSIERTSPEEVVVLNEQQIEKDGLSKSLIKQQMEQAFAQIPAGEITVDDETVPLSVTWDEQTNSKSDLLDLSIFTAEGKEKTLAAFASLNTIETPNEITHDDGERYLSISADIEGRDLGTINREVQRLIENYETPDGYSLSTAGDLEQQQELIMDMVVVFGIAIFLVYLVMAVQFNHLGHPFIVMSVIPMTIVGVIIGLFLTQRELSALSAMGVVMLIGIVLNNAILLIDRTKQMRSQGLPVDIALIKAGKDRIRPIFMTTLTTVGGMLPLALASGTSGNYQAPMATVIISGLLFATFITLLLIPAVYCLFTRRKNHSTSRTRNKLSEDQEEAAI
ncbi:efflux RND transporter permease subunit [Sediminibacillus massiliensis]|uniref:efflux RND transporter permease subunit n=1 Tax=Sediminibacillus massiliensis TaxID=1926277 RepID=UPI000988645E|nr:efflux RND transporter permease subunit [Sediminibacillus massiliensis]